MLLCVFTPQETLGLSEDVPVGAESNFLLSGGDSLQALRFCDSISVVTGISSAGLLEVVLDGSYSDILSHVTMATFPEELDLDTHVASKRQYSDSNSPIPPKRQIDPFMAVTSIRPVGVALASDTRIVGYVVRRAGEVVKIGHTHASENISTTEKTTKSNWMNTSPSNECVIQQIESAKTALTTPVDKNDKNEKPPHMSGPPKNSSDSVPCAASALQTGTSKDSLSLRVRWSSDTGRCVDASPVLLVESISGAATVFIGSHSHRMQALDLGSGELRWERVLGERLESSAAISACGTLVVVGQCPQMPLIIMTSRK